MKKYVELYNNMLIHKETGDWMILKDIIVPVDFFNLTNDDIKKILTEIDNEEIDNEISEDDDIKNYLFNKKDVLFASEKVTKILKNKILAGKTSIKWYKISANGINDIEKIKRKLESEENYYNSFNELDTSKLDNPKTYTCIKTNENVYLMRVLVPSGTKTIDDGYQLKRVNSIKNTVLIIDLENKYIEIRTNNSDARRIVNHICIPLMGQNIVEVDVLSRYGGHIENFKNALYNGKFIDVTSIPDLSLELTKEQSELLVSVLKALDEYFIDRDIEKFKNELLNVDLGTEEIPFTQLFLAGLSKIGLATRIDIEDDLSNQSLYGVLKSYITNQKGFIRFTLNDDENVEGEHTIQLGIKTNSIYFRSSSTEQVIEYVRKKILGY